LVILKSEPPDEGTPRAPRIESLSSERRVLLFVPIASERDAAFATEPRSGCHAQANPSDTLAMETKPTASQSAGGSPALPRVHWWKSLSGMWGFDLILFLFLAAPLQGILGQLGSQSMGATFVLMASLWGALSWGRVIERDVVVRHLKSSREQGER
jgi:hypothetical protein